MFFEQDLVHCFVWNHFVENQFVESRLETKNRQSGHHNSTNWILQTGFLQVGSIPNSEPNLARKTSRAELKELKENYLVDSPFEQTLPIHPSIFDQLNARMSRKSAMKALVVTDRQV